MNKLATFFRESGPARFFIPAGIILIIFGAIVFFTSGKTANYVEIESTVSRVEIFEDAHTDDQGERVEATYKSYVKFTVDNKEYEAELGVGPKRNEGDKIKVFYNSSNPSEITQNKGVLLPIIITCAGIISTIVGIISASKAINRYKKMKAQEEGWSNGK